MKIKEKISEDLKSSMKAKDTNKTTVLRSILSEFTNELVNQKKSPQDKVDDEMALSVLQRLAKQRRDSIDQFQKGGREDLVESEKRELEIIEEYLPEMMDRDEVKELAISKKEELGLDDKKDMGKLIGVLMKDLKGKADGSIVKEVVEELFSV